VASLDPADCGLRMWTVLNATSTVCDIGQVNTASGKTGNKRCESTRVHHQGERNEKQTDQCLRGRSEQGPPLFVKKSDFSNSPYRWLTAVSAEEGDSAELQLALNDNAR
jgi:hypothetical protein